MPLMMPVMLSVISLDNVLYFGRFYYDFLRVLIPTVLLHGRLWHLLTAKYSASLSKILTCIAIRLLVSKHFSHWCSKYRLTFYHSVHENVPEYNLRNQPIAAKSDAIMSFSRLHNEKKFDCLFKYRYDTARGEKDRLHNCNCNYFPSG